MFQRFFYQQNKDLDQNNIYFGIVSQLALEFQKENKNI